MNIFINILKPLLKKTIKVSPAFIEKIPTFLIDDELSFFALDMEGIDVFKWIFEYYPDRWSFTSSINAMPKKYLTEDNMVKALENGYIITFYSPKEFKESEAVFNWLLKNPNEELYTIDFMSDRFFTEEIILKLLGKGHEISADKFKDSQVVFNWILENKSGSKLSIINYMNEKFLTDETMISILKKRYIISNKSSSKFKESQIVFDWIIDNKSGLELEVINYMPENLLTEENMNKLFEKGYEINYRSKEKIVNFMVNKDINKISLLTEIQFDNLIKTNSNILDKYYTQFSGEEKKVLQHLINTFGLYNIIKNMIKSILNQDFINAVGEEFFLKMNKYLIMAETDFKINEVLNIININSVINLYSKIFGSLNSNIESVIKFNKLVSGIHNHQELFLNIIDNINLLDENNLKVLNNLIDNNDKTLNFFKTVDDIINYKQIMFKQNKKDFNNINEIKDAITNMLCNTSYYAAEKFLNTIVNPAKLEDLKKSFNGKDKEDLKCLLNLTKYSSIINLLDRIIKETDITKLNEIKNNLNIALHSENSKVSSPMFSFSEMETDIKKIYAIAYQKTMLNVPKSEQDSEVKIIEDIPDNFGMFVHVMNAYGDGATLEDYKNPRPFGTTYICLSYLNQYQFDSVKRKVIDKDHVTLGFSEFSPDMIQLCGNQDIYSRGGTNNLNLSSNELNFLEPSTMSFKTTRTYNEFVMYREDDKGKSIYPTCVISREEKPLDAEIEAAKNLGVPIVVLNQKD